MNEKNIVSDLAFDVIRDSKRRILFYDEKTKETIQLHAKDIKWVKLYQFKLVVSFFIFYLAFLFLPSNDQGFRTFYSLLAGNVCYLVIALLFRGLFFKNKQRIKLKQELFDLRYRLDVLKLKRMVLIYSIVFSILYSILFAFDLMEGRPTWFILLFVGIQCVGGLYLLIRRFSVINSQIKLRRKYG